MPPVDLTFARATYAETVLLDRATVWRLAPGARAAVFNDETGDYENERDDSVTLAVDAPCKVTDEAETASDAPGRQREKTVVIGFAFGTLDDIAADDRIRITTSEDPRIVGVTYLVIEVIEKTLRVSRQVRCVRRFSGDRNPQ